MDHFDLVILKVARKPKKIGPLIGYAVSPATNKSLIVKFFKKSAPAEVTHSNNDGDTIRKRLFE